jgi:pimeloyl-ACP methyl ester carboxylesterase
MLLISNKNKFFSKNILTHFASVKIFIVLVTYLFLVGCSVHHKDEYPVVKLDAVKSHSVPVSQGKIEYYRFGRGSPIVLIPGYMTDISSWNQQFLLALSQHHQLIVINNRNVGRSIIHSTHYESKDLANDVYQLMQSLHLNKPAVLGISMGGMIAQQLAIDHADQISYLILINTMIAGSHAVYPDEKVKRKLLNIPTNKFGLYATAVELFFPSSVRAQMAYSLAVNRFNPQDYKEINLKKILLQQQHLITQWNKDNKAYDKLSKLSLPTLILNGEADAVIPPINSVILADTIRGARLVRWRNGGHAMLYQYPEQIARVINSMQSL